MPFRLMSGIAVVLLGIAACGRGKADTVPIQGALTSTGEATVVPHQDPAEAAPLVGKWELRSVPPQRPPGLQLTITVNTAVGAQFSGSLTHYFSGNVGGDPKKYEAFADTVRNGIVKFFVQAVDRRMMGILLQGTVLSDTIPLDLFVLGPDTLSPGSRHWFLVKSSGGA